MTSKEVIAVLDGDEIAYSISAACEKRSINVTNIKSGQVSNFKHRTEMKKFLDGLEIPEDCFEVKDLQEPDDIANCLHSVKVVIENIKTKCKADKIEVYLSGKDNFRNTIPLPSQYKSNRKDTLKPVLLDEVRNYIQTKYKATIVNGQETDDKVSQRMFDGYKSKQKIIGVTVDKDAMQNAGWLFNRDKMEEPEFIDGTLGSLWIDDKNKVRGKGRKWLYLQWIIGDKTDFYDPTEICKVRYGEKSAYKLLNELQTDAECIKAIYELYLTWYPEITTFTSYDGIERKMITVQIMQMYLDCARMRRFEGDIVYVEDLLKRFEITYEKQQEEINND